MSVAELRIAVAKSARSVKSTPGIHPLKPVRVEVMFLNLWICRFVVGVVRPAGQRTTGTKTPALISKELGHQLSPKAMQDGRLPAIAA
jgi:hypothetical protein